jgi:diguanylate cyclase (GGDEF)-like protein/PAS domain S-box-containing protein
VDPRRWWLLAVALPVLLACTAAAANPALSGWGDLAVVLMGVVASTTLWVVGGRPGLPWGWRFFALGPLFPVLGAALAAAVDPADPLDSVVLRWVPTVPGYLIAIIAILGLVDPVRLRAGRRTAVEVALFLTACLVLVQVLVVRPVGSWSELGSAEQLVLAAAVLVTSATMAAALTVLGVVEQHRRPMAVVLLAGTVLLTSGRGLGTSATLSGAPGALDLARFLVSGGLLLLCVAVLADPGREAAASPRRPAGRGFDLGQLLPYVALLVAVVAAGALRISGRSLDGATWVGIVLAVLLATVHRWVTGCEQHRMAGLLRRNEAYFRSLVDAGHDAVVLLDADLRVSWASPSLDRILGPESRRLVGRLLLDEVNPEDAAGLAAALADPGAGLRLLRLRGADGGWHYLEAGVSDLRDLPDVGAVVLQMRDMTERHAREQALLGVAYTDPMTGLPNRAGMVEAVEAALADPDAPATLLMIELDGLADARAAAGREVTSTVVAEIGRRLRATVRGEDVVARLGGGAFAVVAAGDEADVDRLAGRCLAVVEQPIATAAGIVDLTAFVGVVPLEQGLALDDVLSRADLAVRASHAAGPGTAQRYCPALGEAAERQQRLAADLRGARARGELFVLFQPVVSLGQQRIAGIEALLRWRHPELGEIPPAEFLPLAERTGLTRNLQSWALEQAAAAGASLPDGTVRMGVDVPAAYLATGALVADVEAALRTTGLAAQRLVLEIGADAVAAADERMALDVSTLRLMGVHVALAGFGGGSSALTHLTRMPIDMVKLDRAFVSRVDRDPQIRALCESVVGIGRALGMEVVAEGVETAAQLAAVRDFGCAYAQGFVLARPMPLAQVTAMLADDAGVLWPGLVGTR